VPTGVYTDDPTIANDAILWRRIPSWHVIFDENLGLRRPSKAAFEDHPNGSSMSVVLAEEVALSGRTAEDVLRGYEEFALAAITAGLAREKNQGVVREPLPEEPAHAVVFGRKTASVKRALARGTHWVLPPSSQ
jgi:hypothetical protein